jgi:AcrR family transcriptional regulator
MKNKKQYHHGDLKLATIQEAILIIKEKNHFEFSMRDISKRLKVSHNAPYKHFENKESLLVEIASNGFNLLTEKLIDATENKTNNSDLLKQIATLYIQFSMEYPVHYTLMFGGIIKDSTQYDTLKISSKTSYNAFRKIIEAMMKQKKIKKSNSNYLTFYAWSLLHGFSSLIKDNRLLIAFDKPLNFNSAMNHFLSYFKKGIL